ncbi:MAG TPA: DsrE/DsrF/DrsH-like family protein [Candidatus Limnocylindrales bacterium]|jgi:peroxiredoxin family protein|nr:DsrE/DsrF/DrsH-like family protein [Candidatus Limnocylindrales bacterium]
MDEQPLSIVLFSGTDDRLNAAAVMVAGAAALGRPVHVFLQYWGLEAFRAGRLTEPRPLAPEAGSDGARAVAHLQQAGQQHWSETLRQAKEIGEVDIQACSLSMDLLRLEQADLDPLVDGVEGVAAFYVSAADGQLMFI